MLLPKDNPFSSYWKKRADLVWSKVVKQTGRCAFCGTVVNLQAHHLIARTNNPTRHKPECGLCLCEYHHLYCPEISPHLHAEVFEQWLRKNMPGRYRWMLRQKSLRSHVKVDYRKAFLKLSHREGSRAMQPARLT
jgi:hypothetical protein